MEEQYRVIREDVCIDALGDELYSPKLGEVVTSYHVQVKGLLWHTVKSFKKIMPAARLLKHLKSLKE